MKLEIDSAKAVKKEGTIKRGDRAGESYRMVSQEAYLHRGDKYPVKVVLPLGDGQFRELPNGDVEGYAPGFYTLAAESFEAGDFDRLQFARQLVLEPLKAPAVKAA